MVQDQSKQNENHPSLTQQSFEFKQKEVIFDQNNCTLIIIRDVTDLIQGEYLKSVEKLSEIMIASTSHDMRTPLNTIINMLKLIKDNLGNGRSLEKWIRIASNSSSLLLFLVSDTLDYFQIKSGKFSIMNSQFSIKDLGEQAFELITVQMEQKKLQKIIEIDEAFEKFQVVCDRQRLSQILVNLFSNALKFTYSGFIKLKIGVADF